eukprot:TRINITY_DN2887_c0_g1_i1.p1 TRINITY_DN2887_c0_g1~~TRINITY_DN2887_c0_g1_i1.p1  ORF type:complete len:444 (-),score=112.84 TRINITY_DN2887_c0_g1_i1:96-1427(-)
MQFLSSNHDLPCGNISPPRQIEPIARPSSASSASNSAGVAIHRILHPAAAVQLHHPHHHHAHIAAHHHLQSPAAIAPPSSAARLVEASAASVVVSAPTISAGTIPSASSPPLVVVDDVGSGSVNGPVSVAVPQASTASLPSSVVEQATVTGVTTLFVSGLPRDTRYREVFNLFRFEPGFEHCSFNGEMGRSPSAWIKFDCIENAQRAMVKFTGFQLDPDGEVVHEMRLELAKKNSLRKQVRSPFDEAMSRFFIHNNQNNNSSNNAVAGVSSKKNDNNSSGNSISGNNRSANSLIQSGTGARKSRISSDSLSNHAGSASGRHVVYLGNLGSNFSDREIHDIVSGLQGFSRVRFARTKQSDTPYSFLEFVDGASAQLAVDRLNGLTTSTSPSAGLRAEIARYGKFRTAPRGSGKHSSYHHSNGTSSPIDRAEFEGQDCLTDDESE